MKNNKFTYDFDGKLLNTKGIKVDKLPPSNYSVRYFNLGFYDAFMMIVRIWKIHYFFKLTFTKIIKIFFEVTISLHKKSIKLARIKQKEGLKRISKKIKRTVY